MTPSVLVVFLAAILAGQCGAVDDQCVRQLVEIGATKVDLQESVDRSNAALVCSQRLLTLLPSFETLNAAERALCGDQLVPFQPRDSDWDALKGSYDGTDSNPIGSRLSPAVNLTSGRWQAVDGSYGFGCVLCRHENGISFPLLEMPGPLEDRTASTKFQVRLITPEARATDEVTEELKDSLAKELLRLLKPESLDNIMFNGASLDHQLGLEIVFRVDSSIALTVATDDFGVRILNGSYNMHVEDVGFCPTGRTYGDNDTVTLWPKMVVGVADTFSFSRDDATGNITRRDCHFDEALFRSNWDPQLTRWELQWESCKPSEDKHLNEMHYMQVLPTEVKLRHDNVLHHFVSEPVDTATIQEVNSIVSRMLQVENRLPEQMINDIANITTKLVLVSDNFVATSSRSFLIVADLKGLDHPMGFTMNAGFNDGIDNITLNRKLTSEGQAPFALDVSTALMDAHTRMVFVVVWMDVPLAWDSGEDTRSYQYPEVTVIFPRQAEVTEETARSYANHHVNITYESAAFMGSHPTVYFNYIVCVAWNYYSREWDTRGCVMLNPTGGNFRTCSCSGEYFDFNKQDRIPVARYALKKGMAADKKAILNQNKI